MRDRGDRLQAEVSLQPAGLASLEEFAETQLIAKMQQELSALQTAIDNITGRATMASDAHLAHVSSSARVLVRKNGVFNSSWKVCWGNTLPELLANCSLHLNFAVKKLFTEMGNSFIPQ